MRDIGDKVRLSRQSGFGTYRIDLESTSKIQRIRRLTIQSFGSAPRSPSLVIEYAQLS